MASEFPAIGDLSDWIDVASAGFAPFDGYETRSLPEADKDLIRAWQFEEFSLDIELARAGGGSSPRLSQLEAIVGQHRDAAGFFVYRALRASDGPDFGPTRLIEPTLSSWSLNPRRALRTARAQGAGPFVLIRDRASREEGSLYVDNFEDEVIREGLFRALSPSAVGKVRLGTTDELVYVSDVIGALDAAGNFRS